MNIHIKSHLLAEMIVLIITTTILYFAIFYSPLDLPLIASWQMLVWGGSAIVGAFNTIYLFAHLCVQNYFKKASQVILFIISWPFQWYVSIFLSYPLILVEIILLCLGKTHIGNRKINLNDYLKEERTALNEEEQQLYDNFVKAYRRRNFIAQILAGLSLLFYGYLLSIMKNEFILAVVGLGILILDIFGNLYWQMIYTASLMKKITVCVNDRCDSRTYYHVSKALCEKYPRDPILVEHYISSLQLDENDYSELREALFEFSRYQKQCFYQLAYMDILPLEEQKRFYSEHYEKIKHSYERALRKSGEYSNSLIYWEIRGCWLNEQYADALQLYDTIKDEGTQLWRVLFAFEKGLCLMRLGKQQDCEELLTFVMKEGNNLRVKYQAEGLLKNMHSEGIKQEDENHL